MAAIITMMGTKIGMTRVFTDAGVSMPVTVIELGPCVVTQVKTEETDGYNAVQIGFGDMKPRNSTIPMIGHDAKAGTDPKRFHREFIVSADEIGEYEVGQVLTATPETSRSSTSSARARARATQAA
jgi:large subunit ribosomal protein L3